MPRTPSPISSESNLGSLLGVMWPSSGIHIDRTPANPLDSDSSTIQTVELMSRLARASSHSPIVQYALSLALSELPADSSSRVICRAIYSWIKANVQFSEDEALIWQGLGISQVDKELLIPPDTLLRMPIPMGDCDDFSLLGASMLLAAGIPCSFVTIAADPNEPDKFSHIYLKACILDEGSIENQDGETKPLELCFDASHGNYLGWEYQGYTRKAEWRVS